MKRYAKQSGSGGRLRLGLLLATATAVLLVPASQASAEPHLKLNIIAQPGASGEVTSDEVATGAPYEGEPPIECSYPVGGPQEGICENLFEKVVHPATGEFLFYRLSMKAIPGPESKLGKTEVVNGEVHAGCEKGSSTGLCTVKTLENGQSEEDVEVNLEFENEVTELRVNLVGIEGGGGEILSPWSSFPAPGTPEIDCILAEGEEQEGVCENEMEELGEGEWGVSLERISAANSDFIAWEIVPAPGTFLVGECAEKASEGCFVASAGPDAELNAIFACDFEIAPTCPPPPKKFPLELTKSGTGAASASFECKIGAGSFGACPAEVAEGEDVEVKVVTAAGSSLDEWTEFTTGTCEGTSDNPCAFEMPEEAVSANAEVNVETFELSATVLAGSGTVACEVNSESKPCVGTYTYNDAVKVVATPEAGNEVKQLFTGGSAACDPLPPSESPGTCEFALTAVSSVEVEFTPAGTIATVGGVNVEGNVPLDTTLEWISTGSECTKEGLPNVNFGDFGLELPDTEYKEVCDLNVTSTGAESVLSVEDGSPTETGHLIQEYTNGAFENTYALVEPLRMSASSGVYPGECNTSPQGLDASPVALCEYVAPVNNDTVTASFIQWIQEHERLHTGVYSKVLTLTLEQTTP